MTTQFKHFSYDNYIAVQITNCLVVHSQTKKAKRTQNFRDNFTCKEQFQP